MLIILSKSPSYFIYIELVNLFNKKKYRILIRINTFSIREGDSGVYVPNVHYVVESDVYNYYD